MRVLRATCVLAVMVCCALPAQAKSFYYASIEVEADVRPDGSMHVSEKRAFAFSGGGGGG